MARRKPKPHRKGTSPARAHCLACGEPAEAAERLRVAHSQELGWWVDERGLVDAEALTLHCRAACLGDLRRHPERAPKAVAAALAALPEALSAWLERAIPEALSGVAAAGQVVGGHDVLSSALREGSIRVVLTATDASPATLASLRRAAPPGVVFQPVALDREALGGQTGQKPRAAVGVPNSSAAQPLLRRLAQRAALFGDLAARAVDGRG